MFVPDKLGANREHTYLNTVYIFQFQNYNAILVVIAYSELT